MGSILWECGVGVDMKRMENMSGMVVGAQYHSVMYCW